MSCRTSVQRKDTVRRDAIGTWITPGRICKICAYGRFSIGHLLELASGSVATRVADIVWRGATSKGHATFAEGRESRKGCGQEEDPEQQLAEKEWAFSSVRSNVCDDVRGALAFGLGGVQL
jgi:hypothetical protein